jgi:hypothetical protein
MVAGRCTRENRGKSKEKKENVTNRGRRKDQRRKREKQPYNP